MPALMMSNGATRNRHHIDRFSEIPFRGEFRPTIVAHQFGTEGGSHCQADFPPRYSAAESDSGAAFKCRLQPNNKSH